MSAVTVMRRSPLIFALFAALLTVTAGTSLLSAPATAKPAPPLVPPQLEKFVAATYPPELLRRGVKGAVVVQLVVQRDGAVGDVKVVDSSDPGFDDAAISAAKRLRFKPATRGEETVSVAIRFRFRFRPEVKRRGRARGLGRYGRRVFERAPSGFSSIEGRLLERGTGKPIGGALVVLPGLKTETITDADGRFRFGLLPKGRHQLYLPGTEHKSLRSRVVVRDGQTTRMTIRPQRQSYVIYRATAEAPPDPGEMTRRSLSKEEIEKVPGVYGDAFRVVQNSRRSFEPRAGPWWFEARRRKTPR